MVSVAPFGSLRTAGETCTSRLICSGRGGSAEAANNIWLDGIVLTDGTSGRVLPTPSDTVFEQVQLNQCEKLKVRVLQQRELDSGAAQASIHGILSSDILMATLKKLEITAEFHPIDSSLATDATKNADQTQPKESLMGDRVQCEFDVILPNDDARIIIRCDSLGIDGSSTKTNVRIVSSDIELSFRLEKLLEQSLVQSQLKELANSTAGQKMKRKCKATTGVSPPADKRSRNDGPSPVPPPLP